MCPKQISLQPDDGRLVGLREGSGVGNTTNGVHQKSGRRNGPSSAPTHTEGVLLLDRDLKVVGFDEGAQSIFGAPIPPDGAASPLCVPADVLKALRTPSAQLLFKKLHFRLDQETYVCSLHSARTCSQALPEIMHVLRIARGFTIDDALLHIGVEYRLTVREQQALRGVLFGLSSKEVAQEMNISPNTVKAFLRLVMGKMGVSSRTGIVAKLFAPDVHGE
jgi:DNA-binding CsgD family transcriptional regulator